MLTLEELAGRFDRPKKSAGGFQVRCPVHEDRNASVSLSEGEKGLVVHCHANCDPEAVVKAVGLEMKDLFYEELDRKPEIDKTYDYVDELGELLYQAVRMIPKDFRARCPDGAGDWVWKLGDIRRVLYRLPEVLEAINAGRRVYVVEGEKDADAIFDAGGVATCNVGGAGKWRPEYTESLSGAHVRIVADKDPPPRVEGDRLIPGHQGQDHAKKVSAELEGVAASCRILLAREGKDSADHLAAGWKLDDFVPFNSKRPIHFRSLDLTQPPPVAKWLIEDICVREEVTLLSGDGGIGKSFLAKGLALAVAGGESMFAGRAVFQHGPVVVVDEENSHDLVMERLYKLGLNESHRENLHYFCGEGIDLSHGPEMLLEDLKAIEPVLVLIDSQSRVLLGVDENSNTDMSAAYRRSIIPLARETGAAVIVLHHTTAGGGKSRGAGGIRNAADQALLSAKLDDDSILVWADKPRRKTHPFKFTIDDEAGGERISINAVQEDWRAA